MNKIPISAVIVTYNEDRYLDKCLKSISFCEEIIVVDLGSTDNSLKIARDNSVKIVNHEKVKIVEVIHSKLHELVSNKWVLVMDPDEVLDEELSKEVRRIFINEINNSSKIGSLTVPWKFYFKETPLIGTVWGGERYRLLLAHIDRFTFTPKVHVGRSLKKGYLSKQLDYNLNNFIHHYWMSSYQQLFEKHRRYLKLEGEARFDKGQITGVKALVKLPYMKFKESFISKDGYKDGLVGLFLSLFWVWYSFNAEFSLFQVQHRLKKS